MKCVTLNDLHIHLLASSAVMVDLPTAAVNAKKAKDADGEASSSDCELFVVSSDDEAIDLESDLESDAALEAEEGSRTSSEGTSEESLSEAPALSAPRAAAGT